MGTLDKEIKVIAVKGERGTDGTDGKSSYDLAIENELFSGTLEEWIETFATPENYITRSEFQKVTQAQYDALKLAGELIPNCYYLIIDSTDAEDFEQLKTDVSNLDDDINDPTTGLKVKVATNTSDIAENTSDIAENSTNILNIIENCCLYRHSMSITYSTYTFLLTLYTSNRTALTANDIVDILNTGNYSYEITGISSNWTYLTFDNQDYTITLRGGSSLSVAFFINAFKYNATITDVIYKVFDLAELLPIENPTYEKEFDYDEGGYDYFKLLVTNPNTSGTLYYKQDTAGTYTSVSIGANETLIVGTYREDVSGTMYLEIGQQTSDIISWSF